MAQEAADKARTEKLDVNKASRDDLMAVPGIGAAGADAIVKYREEHGRFRNVDDLVNVPGIGEATLGQARERLNVSGGRGTDDNGASRRAGGERQHQGGERQHQGGERQAESSVRRTGAAAAEATQRTAEQVARGAEETARQTANAARETAERGAEVARRAGEMATEGYGELFTFGREGVEGVARASQAMLNGASELNNVWMSFWNEQLSQSMETMRAMAECRTWHEALELQSEFTRASFERVAQRATRSAELTAGIIAGSL
ncbi:MAG TPA: helix-hairpin-helix domain-containing protein, partial [Geminicoccaceae bacterium]|nr:helix-hairpin-helix domain-containing protein [Geminicoccaceae bacterium]